MKKFISALALALPVLSQAQTCQVIGNTVFCSQSQRVSAIRATDLGNIYRDAAEADLLKAQAEHLRSQTEYLRRQTSEQLRQAEVARKMGVTNERLAELCRQPQWYCSP